MTTSEAVELIPKRRQQSEVVTINAIWTTWFVCGHAASTSFDNTYRIRPSNDSAMVLYRRDDWDEDDATA